MFECYATYLIWQLRAPVEYVTDSFSFDPDAVGPLTKIHSRACAMECRSRSLSSRVFLRRLSSTLVPVSGLCDFWIKQRGHGHVDKYFIHARSILYEFYSINLHRNNYTYILRVNQPISHHATEEKYEKVRLQHCRTRKGHGEKTMSV